MSATILNISNVEPSAEKRCYACKRSLVLDAFAKDRSRRDGLAARCRECAAVKQHAWHEVNADKKNEYSRRWYKNNKPTALARNANCRRAKIARMVERFKSAPCMDCRQSYPPCVMDFDHRPEERKLFGLGGTAIAAYALERVMAEIAKCDLVCANCHRLRTQRRRTQAVNRKAGS